MMNRILLLLPLLFLQLNLSAQTSFKIEGSIVYTASVLQLENAIVTVLQARDSIFVDHARTDADGKFVFNELDSGEYFLVAIHPNYLDFVDRFTLSTDTQSKDFGNINMMLISELLEEVVITSRNAITIKGDTIEFDANQYTVQKNARVEDLLMQLPGFQVDMVLIIGCLGFSMPSTQLNPNDTSFLRIYNGVIVDDDFQIARFDRIEKINTNEDLRVLGFDSLKSILIVEHEMYRIESEIDSVLYNRRDFITTYNFPLDIQLPLSINNKLLSHDDKKEKLRDLTLDRIVKIKYIDGKESMKMNEVTPFGMVDITLR